ncbi:MAG: IS256 family transposase, partial [Actinomycetota bacterium]|nr:IS256 family transposase [Actinomycetota bacterium]
MTDMLNNGEDTGLVGRPRRDAGEPRLVDEALAEQLVERARAEGVELLGDHGLLRAMTKAVL